MAHRPVVWMLVGVPCSGKSTWIQNANLEKGRGRDTTILSTDNYIEQKAKERGLTYNEVFHDVIKEADRKMWDDLRYAIDNGHNIIWDQTNLNRKSRAKKLIMIPITHHKIAVVFPTPDAETLNIRLNNRFGKNIPWVVMMDMIHSFAFPSIDEGFDEIILHSEGVGLAHA